MHFIAPNLRPACEPYPANHARFSYNFRHTPLQQTRMTRSVAIVLLSVLPLFAQSLPELAARFDYDRHISLDVREVGVTSRAGARVHDISYASPKGGRVAAYLVVPDQKHLKPPFAAVIWGHWRMAGSPTRNRSEFLEEAVVLARSGLVSLLPQAVFARPGFVEDPKYETDREGEAFIQQVVDLRRAVDLLFTRKDVDHRRIAYVGHSYSANVGGVLSGVERRIKTFVLMAGSLDDEEFMTSADPQFVAFRRELGEENMRRFWNRYGWTDPKNYVSQAAPASVLLQYARNDGPFTEERIRRYFSLVSHPKALKIYEATHALNAEARRDRYAWLRKELNLAAIDLAALDQVPPTR